jgi:peptidoglycan hydrolase CwlO-like protein
LRQDVRSINGRIGELKRLIHLQHKIEAMETKSAEKKEMYLVLVADYHAELGDLKSQLEELNNSVKNLEDKLDE